MNNSVNRNNSVIQNYLFTKLGVWVNTDEEVVSRYSVLFGRIPTALANVGLERFRIREKSYDFRYWSRKFRKDRKIGEKPDCQLVKLNHSLWFKVTVIKLYAVFKLFEDLFCRTSLYQNISTGHWKFVFVAIERNYNSYISNHNFHLSRERDVLSYSSSVILSYCCFLQQYSTALKHII